MKRLRYKAGDIILMPVHIGTFAPARILNNTTCSILLQQFAIKPIKDKRELPPLEEIVSHAKTNIVWSLDGYVRAGYWEKIGNIPLEGLVEMPMHWSCTDVTQGSEILRRFYIQRVNFNDSIQGIGEKITIEESEKHNYLHMGLRSEEKAIWEYQKFLLKEGLIDKLIDEYPYYEEYYKKKPKKSNYAPFSLYKDEDTEEYYVTMETDGKYKQEFFDKYGMTGSGDDWVELAEAYLSENMPEKLELIEFDPEAGMFVAFSEKRKDVKTFIEGFLEVCNNDELLNQLFKKLE